MSVSNGYVFKTLVALDIFVCGIVWRDPDVTISSETGLALRRPNPPAWAKGLGWILDHIQPNHCENAIAWDIARAQAAIEYLSSTPQPQGK